MDEKTEMLLRELANMSVGDLPKDFMENHKNIWRAFYIGKEVAEQQAAAPSDERPIVKRNEK